MREAGACSFHAQMPCERSNPTVRGAAVYESAGPSSGRGKHKGGALSRIGVTFLILGAIVMAASTLGECWAAQAKGLPRPVAAHPASITIDYPLDGSIFPPEITPPTFIWRDAAANATRWRIDIAFADGSAGMHVQSAGERLAIGEIDPRCISSTNELPKLTPEQAAAHTWIPEAGAWEAIKQHSVAGAAVVTISGFSRARRRSMRCRAAA